MGGAGGEYKTLVRGHVSGQWTEMRHDDDAMGSSSVMSSMMMVVLKQLFVISYHIIICISKFNTKCIREMNRTIWKGPRYGCDGRTAEVREETV